MSTKIAATCFQMFHEPGKAFMALRQESRGWLPLLLVTLGTALMVYWYYTTVDVQWLTDHTLAATPDISEDQREAARKLMHGGTMSWIAIGGFVIGTSIMYALYALYYLLAGKFMDSEISYGKWFALTAWSSLPRLLVLPLMAIQIMTSDGKVALEDLSMTSLNFLLFNLPLSHPWAGIANSLDLTLPWSVMLSVVGLRVWTGRSLPGLRDRQPSAATCDLWLVGYKNSRIRVKDERKVRTRLIAVATAERFISLPDAVELSRNKTV